MTGAQYSSVAHWTLANMDAETAKNSLSAIREVFKNCGVAFPNGEISEVMRILMSDKYMGWENCTYRQAQEYANAGIAAVGIDGERIVIILPEEGERKRKVADINENAAKYVKQVSRISIAERMPMQFFAYYSANTTTDRPLLTYRLLRCYQTENRCYQKGESIGNIMGIVVHSTGAANPNLKRYVDYPEELGTNEYGNHWNNSDVSLMVHAFIGKDKNGQVAIVNTLPYEYACWGVGNGTYGSYNYSPTGHIQFEICEDNLTDINYFNDAVFGAAAEYCAYLCKSFALSVNSIVSHKEAHDKGYGSNHGDPDHWLAKFGKNMNDFRARVTTLLANS